MRRGHTIVRLMLLNGLTEKIRTEPNYDVHYITLMTRHHSQTKSTNRKKKTNGGKKSTSTSQPITGTLTAERGATT